MQNRVFARYLDDLWVGVAWLGERTELTRDMEYATVQVAHNAPVCMTMPDGRTLCDFGPEHEHG